MNTQKVYLSFIIFSLSCIISLCFAYPSKSKHIRPLCSSRELSARLENLPLKHIDGSFFFSSLRSALFFSFLIWVTSSLDLPSLILSIILTTSMWNGVSVFFMSLNIVTVCVILVSVLCRLKSVFIRSCQLCRLFLRI